VAIKWKTKIGLVAGETIGLLYQLFAKPALRAHTPELQFPEDSVWKQKCFSLAQRGCDFEWFSSARPA
jgi:hypothetical protein